MIRRSIKSLLSWAVVIVALLCDCGGGIEFDDARLSFVQALRPGIHQTRWCHPVAI